MALNCFLDLYKIQHRYTNSLQKGNHYLRFNLQELKQTQYTHPFPFSLSVVELSLSPDLLIKFSFLGPFSMAKPREETQAMASWTRKISSLELKL